MSRQKLVILFTVLVDVIGFGIVIPILPFYLAEFGASPSTITLLFSVYAFCAFLSSPFLGALSDRIGRRPILLVSIFSTAIGWFIFSTAAIIPLLFVGRIIDGLAAGNFIAAQGYLVDIAKDDKERISNLGIIGATFGIGFIVGPIFGGILSKVSHSFPFFIAGIMATINGISAFFFLNESNHNRSTAKLKYNPLLPIIKAFRAKSLRPLYVVWLFYGLAFVVVQSVFALFSQKVFGFDAFQTGLFFTIMGIVIVINQVVLLNKFWTKRFTEKQLERIMLMITVVGLILISSENLILFFVSLPLIGTGQAILRVVITSQAVSKVDPKTKGEIMGIIASIMTGSMVIGPLFSGQLFEVRPWLPFLLGSILSSFALVISFTKEKNI
jgi:MFS transporter, DHA1 family, tetracycline resistance protein